MSILGWFFLGVLVSVTLGVISYYLNKRSEDETDREISEVKDEVKEIQDDVEDTKKEEG